MARNVDLMRSRAAALHKSGRISARAYSKAVSTAPDHPSAEPVSDIQAQLKELGSASRSAVWLPADTVGHMRARGALAKALKGGHSVEDFDGKGGILIAKDAATAEQAMADREGGGEIQKIVGALTGDGHGKPEGATHVVQQVDHLGNVTRERLVLRDELPTITREFRSPGKAVKVTSLQDALSRRAAKVAAERR